MANYKKKKNQPTSHLHKFIEVQFFFTKYAHTTSTGVQTTRSVLHVLIMGLG